jgi:hypothetical protein
MRSRWFVALIVVVSAAGLKAQVQAPRTMMPVPPLPQIGLPLPQIGLPTPATEAARKDIPGAPGLHRNGGGNQQHRGGAGRGRSGPLPTFIYLTPMVVAGEPAATAPMNNPAAAAHSRPSTGTLWLDLQQADPSQVYVDAYYIGTTDTICNALELEAGPHNVELRAPGFDTIQFDVRIAAQQTLTYRDTPRRQAAARPPIGVDVPPARTPAPVTLYVIPGCYAGNVPPEDVALPHGCDRSRVVTLPR